MSHPRVVRSSLVLGGLALLPALVAARAHAALPLYNKEGWAVATDGRAQGFFSYANGDAGPKGGSPSVDPKTGYTGDGGFAAVGDGNRDFSTSRLRGGWAASVLGFSVTRQISQTLKVSARLSFWFTVENDQAKGPANNVGSFDIRQGYLKLDGTWGGLLFGRDLGLHARQAIIQNAILSDGNGVGSPCNITGLGFACGQAGYGVLFPGFNPGIVYNTPSLGGLVLSVGAFDPVRFDAAGWGQTPLPRLEFEATFSRGSLVVFGDGMWQRIGKTGAADVLDAVGVGYGARVQLGPLHLGFLGGYDRGGGMYVPLGPGDMALDSAGQLRTVQTYWGQVMYSLGNFDVTSGVGAALAQQTPSDVAAQKDPLAPTTLIRSQVGINAGLLYHLDAVVLVAQLFRMQHQWFNRATQNANVVNLGATFNW